MDGLEKIAAVRPSIRYNEYITFILNLVKYLSTSDKLNVIS